MQTILVVEDHTDARREMASIVVQAFGNPTVHDAPTIERARGQLSKTNFDLIVLDLGLPDGKGEDFILEILETQPNAYIVISTIHDESERLLSALQNGAKGYLLKEQQAEHLVSEFRGILKGKPPLAPAVTRRVLEHLRNASSLGHTGPVPASLVSDDEILPHPIPHSTDDEDAVEHLTNREREILVLLSKGFSRPEIAGILGISKHTVATHVGKVYGKLGISTRTEAAVIAEQHGLL